MECFHFVRVTLSGTRIAGEDGSHGERDAESDGEGDSEESEDGKSSDLDVGVGLEQRPIGGVVAGVLGGFGDDDGQKQANGEEEIGATPNLLNPDSALSQHLHPEGSEP